MRRVYALLLKYSGESSHMRPYTIVVERDTDNGGFVGYVPG